MRGGNAGKGGERAKRDEERKDRVRRRIEFLRRECGRPAIRPLIVFRTARFRQSRRDAAPDRPACLSASLRFSADKNNRQESRKVPSRTGFCRVSESTRSRSRSLSFFLSFACSLARFARRCRRDAGACPDQTGGLQLVRTVAHRIVARPFFM